MDQITWKTEVRRVKDLTPYDKNPRQISKHQLKHLKQSLKKFDYCELIAIQPDGTIIAGHMRVKAMKQMGLEKRQIEVRVPNRQLTTEEMREYLIRSNKNIGDWDYDILANDWEVTDLHEYGFEAKDFGIMGEDQPDVNEKSTDESKEAEKCPTCGRKMRKKK